MEIKVKLHSIADVQKGTSARGDWTKHGFVIETEEAYPKKIFIGFWNNKFDLSKFEIGEMLNISINIESREFNGKWYTDITAWKIEKTEQNQYAQPSEDMPPPPPPPIIDEEASDDLPF